MALKFIQQDATTLREAYQERKAEYMMLCGLRKDGQAPSCTLELCLNWH